MTLPLEQVGSVDAGRYHSYEKLPRRRDRIRDLCESELVGTAGFRNDDCAHGDSLSHGRAGFP